MSVKCAVCGKAIVSKRGQVCIACQVKQNSIQGNIPVPDIQGTYTTGQPQNLQTQQPLYTQPAKTVKMKNTDGEYYGTVHNFQRTEIKKSTIWKWMHALWYGVPYTQSNIQYEFTLYEGDGMSTVGINGHEVVMYGDAGYTLLSDNSVVRVKGKKDKNGVVMASEIIGANTGFHLRPKAAVSPHVVRLLTVMCVLLLIVGIFLLTGLQSTTEITQTANTVSKTANVATQSTSTFSTEKTLMAVVVFLAAALILKSRVQKRWKYGTMLILLGLGMFSQTFLILLVIIIVYWLMRRRKDR